MRAKSKIRQFKADPVTPTSLPQVSTETLKEEALAKYKELYAYSTEILLKEHERFNRCDEKASKYSTTFVFLIGGVAYFDKWIFEKFPWTDFPAKWPDEWPLYVVGFLALFTCAAGWFVSIHVIRLKPIVSRPLNPEMLNFFENQSLLNIYYGLARENSNAYESNTARTNQKLSVLVVAHGIVTLALAFLVELLVMYCLYSWC